MLNQKHIQSIQSLIVDYPSAKVTEHTTGYFSPTVASSRQVVK